MTTPSRRWIVFFVVLAVLGATAIVAPLVYNLSIQLRPEQLADAQRRWRENAPANYDLACLVKSTFGGVAARDRECFVQVREGRVVHVVDDGEVVYVEPSLAVVAGPAVLGTSWEDPRQYGVPALFAQMEATLREDESADRRSFATASFNAWDGYPLRYVHRVRSTKDRVEWNIKLTRIDDVMRP